MRIAALLILLSIADFPTFAQSEAGTAALSGTVSDASGARVPNAKITLKNQENGLTREMASTDSGTFAAARLTAGLWSVTVEAAAFRMLQRTGLRLEVGSALTLDLNLEVGATADAVTISGGTPLIETGNSSISTVVNERSIRTLPINGRNFLDFTVLTPGVVRDPSRTGDLSFAGQHGPSNSLLIDGMDANSAYWGQSTGRAGFRNPYSFSQDSVQEFQVLANSFAAEIGRATGGVVNVITKSGTNDFHGAAFWYFRDRAMNANTFFNNKNGLPRQPYHFNQFGANLGGPVLRNRLFFFYNYDGLRNTLPNPVYLAVAAPADAASQAAAREIAPYLSSYTTGLNNNIHTVKLDWFANARHVFSGRYNNHRFLGANLESPGPQSSADHSGNTTLNTDNLALTHTWTLSPRLILDQRFLYLHDDNPSSVGGQGPEVVVRQSGVTALTFGTANFLPRSTVQDKYGVVQTANLAFGKHAFKFGHDFKWERATNLATNLFAGQYTFNSYADFANRVPASYAQAFPIAGTSGGLTYPDIDMYALFAQDTWRATNALTVNYGVRYDVFQYAGNSIRNQDPGLRAMNLQTGVFPTDYGNVAGRLGIAYRIDPKGRVVFRAAAGTFYGVLAGLAPRTIQAQNGVQVQSYTLSGAAIPKYPATLSAPPVIAGAVPDIYVVQPDFASPRTHQWNAQFELALTPDLAMTVGYIGVRGTQLTQVRDINLFPALPVAATLPDNVATIFFRHPALRPDPAFGRISLLESGADSMYHGGFIQMSRRYKAGFQVLGSYTFSKVIDTAPWGTSFIPNSAAEDPNLVFDTLNPKGDRGIGDANVAHRAVISGTWDIPSTRGAQLSAILNAQSGRWYSARTNVDLNNDGNRFTDRPPGYGRNTIEGPAQATLDLRASKGFRLWREGVELRVIAEGFNILNRANFSTFNQTALNYVAASNTFTRNAAFTQPTATTDPRILQIAARVTF